ncbi:MAG TPA: lytic transglycosylase domain-containing protein [Gemmatimonadales bacterium]|nr:lytic transglycosylase domain-containing protein [Gemmatimonadales bacterium]
MTASGRPFLLPTALRLIAGAGLAIGVPAGRLAAQAAPPHGPLGAAALAGRALEQGQPYRATRLLEPLLAFPGGAPDEPQLVLLAARAAAGWDGWGNVVRLLAREPWLDQREAGEGRALLARARLERGDSAALDDAVAAVRTAPGEALGSRLVTLARALDQANRSDSAAAVYRRAAARFPSIADWLLLRAAGVTADSSARAGLYHAVVLPAATPRIRWTEAEARERAGDLAGAARAYASVGATLSALRLRLAAVPRPDSAAGSALKRELLGLLAPRATGDDALGAIALLDARFAPLTREDQLAVARRAAVTGPFPRAIEGFAHAGLTKPLSESDRITYGRVLARLSRHREAMALLATVRSRALRPEAQYQRARSLLAVGRRADALAALRLVSTTMRYDTATAATAGFLAAELLVDGRNDAGARKAYLDVAKRFPRTGHGERAALQAALLALLGGNARTAAREFTALAERPAGYGEAPAALYWAGRALLAAGESAAARARWRAVRERYPSSYYSVPASERLGASPVVLSPPGRTPAPADSGIRAALDRGALLFGLGLRLEARLEYDRAARVADASPEALLALANALAERGEDGRAFRLAARAAERSPSQDVALQRLLFPLPRQGSLVGEARQAGVDPLLAAALIRQESAFDPAARSAADARGLMQVLPSLGASLARAEGLRDWDPALLYQPEINLHFGLTHLAQMLKRYPRLEAALAAYNAGGRPAELWLGLRGADDPEVFIERVQYVETRDYVRRILRNLAVYRVLYPELP